MERITTTCLINNYNYANFVGEAIEGALRQTTPFNEIIVVDDGSTDGSLELLKARYGRHANVKIVGKRNEGQLSSFNEGFAHATGDFIFFLDADDVYEPDYVEKALNVYRRDPRCDFISSGRRMFGAHEELRVTFPEDRDLGYSVVITALRESWIGAPTSCLSMRRHVLEKILPLPFTSEWRTRADDCLIFGSSLAGARKRYLAKPLVRYRVHNTNAYFGQKRDASSIYRRSLAMNRLFEHLERKLCYNASRLAEIAHIEFQTIEKPTIVQLSRYIRICTSARVSFIRRISAVVAMVQHFVQTRKRSESNVESAAATPASRRKVAA